MFYLLLNQMKRKVLNLFLVGALLLGSMSSFVSCKDYDEDNVTDLQGRMNETLNDALTKYRNRLEFVKDSLGGKLQDANERVDSLNNALTKGELTEDQKQALAGALADAITEKIIIGDNLTKIQNAILGSEATEGSVLYRIFKLEETLGLMGDSIENVINRKLLGVNIDIEKLRQQVKADSTWIANFKDSYKNDTAAINKRLDDLLDSCGVLRKYVDEQAAACNLYTDNAINSLSATLNTRIDSVKNAMDSIAGAINGRIDSLNVVVDSIKAAVAKNTLAIDTLKNRVDSLENLMDARLVTSIIVQGTENPAFGSIALPLDIRSNVLMAYYGTTEGDVEFPTTKTGQSYNGVAYLTAEQLNILKEAGLSQYTLGAGETLLNNKAGKIYLTVNPTSVDFSRLNVSLVNSQDTESGIKLSILKKSDKKLTFGYTRGADNGFYEADATLSEEDINKVKINIEPGLKSELADLLQAAKDLKNGNYTGINFTGLVSTVYNQFNGVLDANAVKTSWTDAKDETIEHSVYSQYNVAATAFKPLSFKFLYNRSDLKNLLPTITPLNDINFGEIGKIDIKLNDISISINEDNIKLNFKAVTISEADKKVTVYVDQPKVVDGEFVRGEDGKIEIESVPYTVNLDKFVDNLNDEIARQWEQQLNEELRGIIIDKIIAQINAQLNSQIINDINTQLGDVNKLIDQFNGLQDKANNAVDLVNKYISRVNKFINRINNFIGNANNYLQVTLLYEDNNGSLSQLSNSRDFYTVMEKGTTAVLHPTTYTGELAVPVFKKYIAVTNVYDGATDKTGAVGNAELKQAMIEANQANELLNKVQDGTFYAAGFTLPATAKSGQIYEITYVGLDYSGLTSARKFYIGVK